MKALRALARPVVAANRRLFASLRSRRAATIAAWPAQHTGM
jgi:hypothetical protein